MHKLLSFTTLFLFSMTGTSIATTIDLDALFVTDGEIYFGDGTNGDFDAEGVVERFFDLAVAPVTGGTFTITGTFRGVDYPNINTSTPNYFTLNENVLDNWNLVDRWTEATQSFTGSNAILTTFGNSLQVTLGYNGYNLDDIYVSDLVLTYEGVTQTGSSVPEPTSVLLLGAGVAGLAAVGRRRKKMSYES